MRTAVPDARRELCERDGPSADGAGSHAVQRLAATDGTGDMRADASLLPWRSRLALGWPLACAGIPRSWQKTTLVCCLKGPIRPCAPTSVPALSVLPGRRDSEKSGFRMAPRAMADYRRFLPREADFDAEPPMKRIGVRRPSSRSACRRAGCRHHGGGLTGTVATVVRRRKADFGASCARRWWVFPVVSGFPARAARPEPHQAPQASAGG